MYCVNCGAALKEGARFCSGCGSPKRDQQTSPTSAPKPAAVIPPSFKMNKKTVVLTGVVVGLLGAAGIGYYVAHASYGPSTPEALETKVIAAISDRKVDALVKYLDPSQTNLKQAEALAAFKEAFTDETASSYKSMFKQAVRQADDSSKPKPQSSVAKDALGDDRLIPFQLVSKKSWRGTKWSFTVNTSEVSFEQKPDWKVEAAVGKIKNDTNSVTGLWPAIYTYEASITSQYGGSKTVKGTVDLINTRTQSIRLSNQMSSSDRFSVNVPTYQGITFTLNGAELPQKKDGTGQNVEISPFPKDFTVQAKGTYMGMSIDESMSLTTYIASGNTADLSVLVGKGLAKPALDLILQAGQAWTEAYNSGNPSLIKGFDTTSYTYKDITARITKSADKKLTLVKAAVASASIRNNQISVNATEQYNLEGATEPIYYNYSYQIQQVPGKNEWTITNRSSNYYSDNLILKNTGISKNNPGSPSPAGAPAGQSPTASTSPTPGASATPSAGAAASPTPGNSAAGSPSSSASASPSSSATPSSSASATPSPTATAATTSN